MNKETAERKIGESELGVHRSYPTVEDRDLDDDDELFGPDISLLAQTQKVSNSTIARQSEKEMIQTFVDRRKLKVFEQKQIEVKEKIQDAMTKEAKLIEEFRSMLEKKAKQ